MMRKCYKNTYRVNILGDFFTDRGKVHLLVLSVSTSRSGSMERAISRKHNPAWCCLPEDCMD